MKKIYIEIYVFMPINSTFYKKNNIDKIFPYNTLEQDISSLRKEGNNLLLGDFNIRTTSNQAILISNNSNPNPIWLDGNLVLASKYKRNSEYLIRNLFGTELVNICNSQDLIICNTIIMWTNSYQMTCIHGLGNSILDYVISYVPISNQIGNFDLLNVGKITHKGYGKCIILLRMIGKSLERI